MDQVGFRGGMRGEDFENPQIKYESGDEHTKREFYYHENNNNKKNNIEIDDSMSN